MSDHSWKLIEGIKLSREEWEAAVADGVLKSGSQFTYEGFIATHYHDGKKSGYICGKHLHREYKDEEGEVWLCSWGFHTEHLDRRYLTDINFMFLCTAFSRAEVLEAIPKTRKKKR